jgi:hypothetical protein
VGGAELNYLPSLLPFVDASEHDGSIVQMMFVLRRSLGSFEEHAIVGDFPFFMWLVHREPFSAGL